MATLLLESAKISVQNLDDIYQIVFEFCRKKYTFEKANWQITEHKNRWKVELKILIKNVLINFLFWNFNLNYRMWVIFILL